MKRDGVGKDARLLWKRYAPEDRLELGTRCTELARIGNDLLPYRRVPNGHPLYPTAKDQDCREPYHRRYVAQHLLEWGTPEHHPSKIRVADRLHFRRQEYV